MRFNVYATIDMYLNHGDSLIDAQLISQFPNPPRFEAGGPGFDVPDCPYGRGGRSPITENDVGSNATSQTVASGIPQTKTLLHPVSTDTRQVEFAKHLGCLGMDFRTI